MVMSNNNTNKSLTLCVVHTLYLCCTYSLSVNTVDFQNSFKIYNYVFYMWVVFFLVIKIRLAVRTVSSCAMAWNAGMRSMPRAKKNRDVLVNKPIVLKVLLWLTVPLAKREENAAVESVYLSVKRKGCRVVCAMSVSNNFATFQFH